MKPELVLNAYLFLETADRKKVRGLATITNPKTDGGVTGRISNEAFVAFQILKKAAKKMLGKKNFLNQVFFGKSSETIHFKLTGHAGVFYNQCSICGFEDQPFDKAFDTLLTDFLGRYHQSVIIPLKTLTEPSF
jgi:hypothetical protein